MDTCKDPRPTDTPPADGPRRFNGCAIAVLVLLVLAALGTGALAEWEKGLDGPTASP
ncbi:hypothetical protein [Streptomyces erythrochromogenes]|uniref:hypothetical protein n=1 Tax=Streptomyces erythrochromogenes TaxID=285574 RepID=UPI003821BBC3